MTTIKFNDLIVSDQISDCDFSGGHVKRGPQTKSAARPGDWPCPDRGCGNRNFSWRDLLNLSTSFFPVDTDPNPKQAQCPLKRRVKTSMF